MLGDDLETERVVPFFYLQVAFQTNFACEKINAYDTLF